MSPLSPERTRVLIIEDDPAIHRVLTSALAAAGYDSVRAYDGRSGLNEMALEPPSAVLLDLSLPDIDGQQVLAQAHDFYSGPIIVLSARSRELEKITALDNGAVDYIEKPFDVGELLARIRAALRRRQAPLDKDLPEKARVVAAGELRIDMDRRLVMRGGQLLRLSSKEHELLAVLAEAEGKVVSTADLLAAVWGAHRAQDIHYLRVFISQMRRKVEANPSRPSILITEKNLGYRLGGLRPAFGG